MTNISRKEAKRMLRQRIVRTFTPFERKAILDELWFYFDHEDRFDAEDIAFYPPEIRKEMLSQSAPDNPDDPKYDFIIAERVSPHLYLGVKNEFLLRILREEELGITEITGENELLEACLCCRYCTISPGIEGKGESCQVCGWINGAKQTGDLSLDEAQSNFRKFGAIDRRIVALVDPDGKEKYERS